MNHTHRGGSLFGFSVRTKHTAVLVQLTELDFLESNCEHVYNLPFLKTPTVDIGLAEIDYNQSFRCDIRLIMRLCSNTLAKMLQTLSLLSVKRRVITTR